MSDVLMPAEAFPVGEYLREELAERGWSETEFAQIIARPVQAVSEILNGKKEITAETAVAIGDALGTSAEFWLGVQAAYRLYQVRERLPKVTPTARRARLRALVPVRAAQKRGWITETKDLEVLEGEVCDFLGISDPSEEPSWLAAARRTKSDGEPSEFTPEQVAWIARVRQFGSGRTVARFDRKQLLRLAESLVRRIRDPDDLSQLRGWLAECGVALVVELPLKGSKIDGVVVYSEQGQPIIGLSTRGDRMDSVVFTLLHEIAHLLEGHIEPGGFHLDEDVAQDDEVSDKEVLANELARGWVLPDDFDIGPRRPTLQIIVSAARAQGVHPSFVIGRVQYDRRDWSLFRGSIPKVRSYLDFG
jgi:HTH-type transcriptional regulator/antitoxin HigA